MPSGVTPTRSSDQKHPKLYVFNAKSVRKHAKQDENIDNRPNTKKKQNMSNKELIAPKQTSEQSSDEAEEEYQNPWDT